MIDNPSTPTPAGAIPPDADPTTTSDANAREQAREEAHETARQEILDAGAELLREVQEIGIHYAGFDPDGWLRRKPLDDVISALLEMIAGVREFAQDAENALTMAVAQHEWLQGDGPLRCMSCGRDIDPERYVWLIADGLPEHDICHQYDPALRARNRAATVAEDEHQAYREERIRSGGPRPGDVVELTYPDGHTVEGVWRTLPEDSGEHWVMASGGAQDGAHLDPAAADVARVVRLAEDHPAPPADGQPVADDVARYGVPCGACRRPLIPGLPAVWMAGRPAHRACAVAAGIEVTGR